VIAFEDFEPRVVEAGGFLSAPTYETVREALADANAWIEERGIRVINVETVVLPNVHAPHEEGTEDPSLRVSGDFAARWHQFIRVWYERG